MYAIDNFNRNVLDLHILGIYDGLFSIFSLLTSQSNMEGSELSGCLEWDHVISLLSRRTVNKALHWKYSVGSLAKVAVRMPHWLLINRFWDW